MKTTMLIALCIVALGSAAAGCDAGESNLGGDGLPVQQEREQYGHASDPVAGKLVLRRNGCWTADTGDQVVVVVFPPGYTKPANDGSVMQAPDGTRITTGMSFDGTGGLVPMLAFPGVPDGYWGGYFTFCAPEDQQVLVLDVIRPVGDARNASQP